jgi:hypothetical protein
MSVDMKGLFKNALNILFSNEVLVTVKGTTRVGKAGIFITVPFSYEGRHKLELFNQPVAAPPVIPITTPSGKSGH